MQNQNLYDQLLAIARGTQLDACEIASKIHASDQEHVSRRVSEIGGWDILATRWCELLAGVANEKKIIPAGHAAFLLGVTAIMRALGCKPRY